jgi:hypothetical protein
MISAAGYKAIYRPTFLTYCYYWYFVFYPHREEVIFSKTVRFFDRFLFLVYVKPIPILTNSLEQVHTLTIQGLSQLLDNHHAERFFSISTQKAEIFASGPVLPQRLELESVNAKTAIGNGNGNGTMQGELARTRSVANGRFS